MAKTVAQLDAEVIVLRVGLADALKALEEERQSRDELRTELTELKERANRKPFRRVRGELPAPTSGRPLGEG